MSGSDVKIRVFHEPETAPSIAADWTGLAATFAAAVAAHRGARLVVNIPPHWGRSQWTGQ